jgi:glycolate oxidase
MNFEKITPSVSEALLAIVGEDNLILPEQEHYEPYTHDETEDLVYYPEVVVKPINTEQISQIMALCYKENIPVTPRAGGTGLSGGALAVAGGVLLSVEKLDQILDIDERNLQVTTEPGVITQVLQEAVIEKGLFYPPDPSSRGTCFIGGNIAENSGGPKAVKYGVVIDYVLNLEMVLPNGEVIWTGANVLKNSTGYNLTQLVVGSEGTLGIVTKIVLKLIPFPTQDLLMLAPFTSPEKACAAVSAIFNAGITPSAMEFMERDAIDWTLKYIENINLPVKDEVKAHLLIEVDGNDMDVLFKECEKITGVLEKFGCEEILFADSAQQKNDLWRLRRAVGEAVKANSVYKEEDTVVPRAFLPELLQGVKDIGAKYGFRSVCYGHAGDGNLHVNIIRGELSEKAWEEDVPKGIREIFTLVKSMKGTISGEHGIGLVQRPYMDIMFNETQLGIMRSIKKVFDPSGILNPGKIF